MGQICTGSPISHMVASAGQARQLASVRLMSTPSGAHLKHLNGHILPALATANDQGKADESQEIPVSVSLSLSNEDQLIEELQQIYQAGSPKFHQFLTPEQFRAKYAPTDAQVASVVSYLQSQGLNSVTTDPNGLTVHAKGKIGSLNAAFNTEIHQYTDAQGHAFRAPSYELQVPEELPIQGVLGLQNRTVAHNHLRGPRPAATGRDGTGPAGGYSPGDIHTAYNLPASLDGSGQTLALFELDGYTSSDISSYAQQLGLNLPLLQNVLIDGADGSAGAGEAEVTLDLELMIALAPNAQKILIYEGPNNDQGMLDTYSRIASDNLAKSVSTSWGSAEDSLTSSFIASENAIFMEMAAQGQTIFSAAGDTGAYDDGSGLSVDDPSAQPFVVGVGGTTLSTNSDGSRSGETTWNDSSGAGGGGISSVWSVPSWQQGMGTTQNMGSTTMRTVPDVSLHADINTGYAIFNQGQWQVWGGTSAAAPLWAAFMALVNQQRAANGLGPVGYVTPTLYDLGRSNRYGSDFFDINDGSTNEYYPAVNGYDLATGLGSFNGAGLLQDLSVNASASGSSPTGATAAASTASATVCTGS